MFMLSANFVVALCTVSPLINYLSQPLHSIWWCCTNWSHHCSNLQLIVLWKGTPITSGFQVDANIKAKHYHKW